jgi:hypothetical protein
LVQIGFSPFSFFDYTAGQFVMGFVFFSSASGGRSGDAAVADVDL